MALRLSVSSPQSSASSPAISSCRPAACGRFLACVAASQKRSLMVLSASDVRGVAPVKSGSLETTTTGAGEVETPAAGADAVAVAVAVTGQVTEVCKDTFWPIVKAAGPKPVVLDMYTQWLFTVTLGQFGVLDHIDGDSEPRPDDQEWVQDDYTIVSWLYSTVSEEILALIITPDDTAFAVWRRIENLFLDNAVTRAVYLDDEFHGQRQGNMTVSAYCARLKSLADRLRDLGRNVTDTDLVHRVLAGLRSDFRHAVTTLSREVPLPSFQDVRSFLVLEESRSGDDDATPAGTALAATTQAPATPCASPPAPALAPTPAPPPPQQPKHKGNGNWNKNKNKGAAPAPATTVPYPWTGMVQAWPYQWRPHYPGAGVLGPRPNCAPSPTAPFAGAAFQLPPTAPVYHAPPAAPAPVYDQAGLIHALQQLSVQQQHPTGGEWVMDTGATSHMASSAGSAFPPGAAPM